MAFDLAGVAVDETTETIYTAIDTPTGTASVVIPASVSVSPPSGAPGIAVTVSGRGFHAGETVKITYSTGLTSPKSVNICTAIARSNTSYTCSGIIPPTPTAGPSGAHKVVAKGATSLIKVKTTFTLT